MMTTGTGCSVVKGTLGSVVLLQYGNFCIVGQVPIK